MTMTRVRLDVAYDGTGFSGWAVQPDRRTVAGELTATLDRVCGPVEGMTVAGRTDAGVHATGQVCHVDVPADRWAPVAGTLVGLGTNTITVTATDAAGNSASCTTSFTVTGNATPTITWCTFSISRTSS